MEETLSMDIADVVREAEARAPDLLAGLDRAAQTRAESTAGTTRSAVAPQLASLSDTTQRRVRTLVLLEELFTDYAEPDLLDYGALVFGVCQLVETEVGRRLQAVSLPNWERLALRVEDAPGPHRIVSAWASGRVPLTLGTVQILYMAWRRALQGGHLDADNSPFSPGFVDQLMNKSLEKRVNELRHDFRNPVAHGGACSEDDHETCSLLCLGTSRIGSWADFGGEHGSALLGAHLDWGNDDA